MDTGADARRVRINLERHAAKYATHRQLPLEFGRRLLEHLDGLRIQPARVLCLGSGPALLREDLTRLFPAAQLLFSDAAPMLLTQIAPASRLQRLLGARAPLCFAGRPEALPLPNASVDLVVSLATLPSSDAARSFAEARRVLSRDGLLLFSTLGPDTLREWRRGLLAADLQQRDPTGRSVPRFPDMHDLADAASAAGLSSPVVDMEYLTVHYPDIGTLLADLRVVGGGNGLLARPRGLMTPRAQDRLMTALEAQRQPQGLPLTLELIYGHAWNTRPLVTEGGRPVIPIRSA